MYGYPESRGHPAAYLVTGGLLPEFDHLLVPGVGVGRGGSAGAGGVSVRGIPGAAELAVHVRVVGERAELQLILCAEVGPAGDGEEHSARAESTVRCVGKVTNGRKKYTF